MKLMTRLVWILLFMIAIIFTQVDSSSSSKNTTSESINYPFPQSINYQFGIKPSVPQEQMNNAVQRAYEDWLNRYVATEGAPKGTYRVHLYTAYDFETVSEGIGWGMLITVLMENHKNQTKKYFDGFWNYYKHYLNKAGLMSWRIDKNGKIMSEESATEADENAAIALFFADKQWGSKGKINYLLEAKDLIAKILEHEVEEKTYVLKPGVWWGGSAATNPAYFNPAYYRIWRKFNKDWLKVLNKSLAIYDIFYNKYSTGLMPDWTTADGTAVENLVYDYTYDACQIPLKIGMDYLWNGKGSKYLDKISNWIIEKTDAKPETILDGYKLDGTAIGKYHNAPFVGSFCVAAMVSKKHQTWLDKTCEHLINMETGGEWGYYSDTLRLISLMIVSGNFPNL
jgi:endo-1,4-beta-D-glucanase Y